MKIYDFIKLDKVIADINSCALEAQSRKIQNLEKEKARELMLEIIRLHKNGDLKKLTELVETSSGHQFAEEHNWCDWDALNSMANYYDKICSQKGIELLVNIPERIMRYSEKTNLSERYFNTIIGNLIDNAVECLEGASIADKQIGFNIQADGMYLICEVINNGPQIKRSDLQSMFDLHYSTKGSGRGVGLHIVSRLVEELNGEINVESNKEITKFIVKFNAK